LPEAELQALVHTLASERLGALGIERLEGILLHRGSDLEKPGVLAGLKQLVESGLCNRVGISTYHPGEAERAIQLELGMIQIIYSLFDRRFESSGFLTHACGRDMKIYARSPFLQGLLLMDPENLPKHMKFAEAALRRWRMGLEQVGMDPLPAALAYSLNNPAIDCVVLGVDTPPQLEEILSQSRIRLSESDLKILENQVGEVGDDIILPYLWPKPNS